LKAVKSVAFNVRSDVTSAARVRRGDNVSSTRFERTALKEAAIRLQQALAAEGNFRRGDSQPTLLMAHWPNWLLSPIRLVNVRLSAEVS